MKFGLYMADQMVPEWKDNYMKVGRERESELARWERIESSSCASMNHQVLARSATDYRVR